MIEYFTEQIECNKRVTEESLIEFNDKTYHSGRVMSVGDIVLFAFLDLGGGNSQLIKLCPDDFDLYEIDPKSVEKGFVPRIKLK